MIFNFAQIVGFKQVQEWYLRAVMLVMWVRYDFNGRGWKVIMPCDYKMTLLIVTCCRLWLVMHPNPLAGDQSIIF